MPDAPLPGVSQPTVQRQTAKASTNNRGAAEKPSLSARKVRDPRNATRRVAPCDTRAGASFTRDDAKWQFIRLTQVIVRHAQQLQLLVARIGARETRLNDVD